MDRAARAAMRQALMLNFMVGWAGSRLANYSSDRQMIELKKRRKEEEGRNGCSWLAACLMRFFMTLAC
jgi:hypothetical protein